MFLSPLEDVRFSGSMSLLRLVAELGLLPAVSALIILSLLTSRLILRRQSLCLSSGLLNLSARQTNHNYVASLSTHPRRPLCKQTSPPPPSSTYFAPVTMLRKLTTLFILLQGEVERRKRGRNSKRETSVEFWCRGKSDDVRKIMPGVASNEQQQLTPGRRPWSAVYPALRSPVDLFNGLNDSVKRTASEKVIASELRSTVSSFTELTTWS